MTATFYNNSSDNNVIDKSLSGIKAVSIVGFENSSIMKPTILLAYDAALFSANYMYIDSMGRYYYITDIEIIDGHRIRITGRVDVLMSFDVKSVQCIAARQSGAYNLYIPDSEITRVSYDRVQTKQFPNSPFTANKAFILAVAGG